MFHRRIFETYCCHDQIFKKLHGILISAFFLLLLSACSEPEGTSTLETNSSYVPPADALFKQQPASYTGIDFVNTIEENEKLNYYTYIHLYMGSGIAAADFNNDGLTDLFFVGELVPNKLFLNKGDLKFEDISTTAGIQGPLLKNELLKTGVAVHDVNGDGWQDIYVCHSGLGGPESLTNQLYINQKDGTFTEESIQRGLNDQSNTVHALFFDYDNDQDLDLYLLNHPNNFKLVNNMHLQQMEDGTITRSGRPDRLEEGDRLFENDGRGYFTEVTEKAGISQRAYGLSVTPMDINEDGWTDLYVGNDFIEPDFLWINQKNGTFVNEIDKYFAHTSHNTMGADAADINNDGNIDFVSLDMLAEDHYRQQTLMTSMRFDRYTSLEQYGYGRQIMHNMLFIKGSDGKMREVGNLSGIDATDWSWSPLIVDLDLDGMNDIFITNGFRRDLTDLDFMTYYDDMIEKGEKPEENIDELMAIVPSKPIPNYVYKNLGELRFRNVAHEWGLADPSFTNGAIHADLDNDGDEDLVMNNIDMQASLYENLANTLNDRHWVQVELKGPEGNPKGIGATIECESPQGTQFKVVQTMKGFLCNSSPITTFGLGSSKQVESITVRWPDGQVQSVQQPGIDQRLTLHHAEARPASGPDKKRTASPDYFGNSVKLVDCQHLENDFTDVKREPLIPRCFSREGPVTEVFDFNNDGLEDMVVSGARGQATRLFIQKASGTFQSMAEGILAQDQNFEDVAIAIADFNNDGFKDIYIASGGNSAPNGSPEYQDRLYLNERGQGLKRSDLPQMFTSTGTVTAADFDNDGDMDLFVGGYITPNAYPLPQRSYLLINDNGNFSDETRKWSELLVQPGMVSSAISHDFNQDNRPDLMLAGEWMPIVWFPNLGNRFGQPQVIPNSSGWWLNLHKADLDQDGDMDIVAGNLGLNTKWSASPVEPMEVYAKDFDQNGKFDALITHYVMGEKVVAARRNILMDQMPALRPDFVKFSKYAKASIQDMVDIHQKDVYHRSVTELSSLWLENKGNGNFQPHQLPMDAQIAPVYALHAMDLNGNGLLEILAGGNDFHLEIETARADGNAFFILSKEAPQKEWTYSPQDGKLDVFDMALRDIDFIKIKNKTHLILSFNDGPLKIYPLKEPLVQ